MEQITTTFGMRLDKPLQINMQYIYSSSCIMRMTGCFTTLRSGHVTHKESNF